MRPATGETKKPRKLLDRVRDVMRTKHYAHRTEKSYAQWIRRFILFHNKRHPSEMAEPEVEAFLTHLAVKGKVAASTQNQALSALLFLYRYVLKQPLGHTHRSRKSKAVQAFADGFDIGRNSTPVERFRGHSSTTGQTTLRLGNASQGGSTSAGQRCRFWPISNYCARP